MNLVATGVSRRFGTLLALAPTTWTARSGEAWALLGPNGSGKSTLLGLIAGVLAPTEGTLTLDGHSTRSPRARVGLGAVTQRATLPKRHTLRTLLRLRHPSPPRDLLDDLRLTPLADRPLHQLSAGQSQRAKLALALHGPVRTLALDEPLTALDDASIAAVMTTVGKRLQAGCTLIVATHQPERWSPLLSHHAHLEHGTFTARGLWSA